MDKVTAEELAAASGDLAGMKSGTWKDSTGKVVRLSTAKSAKPSGPLQRSSDAAVWRNVFAYRDRQTANCAAENEARGRRRNAADIAAMRAEVRKAHVLKDQERGVIMAAGFDPAGDDAWHVNGGRPAESDDDVLPSMGDTVPDAEMRRSIGDDIAREKARHLATLADPDARPISKAVAWLSLANVLGTPVRVVDNMRIGTAVAMERETRELFGTATDETPLQMASGPIGRGDQSPPALRVVKFIAGSGAAASSKLAMACGLEGRRRHAARDHGSGRGEGRHRSRAGAEVEAPRAARGWRGG
ncbi:hypothetical protein C2U70_23895 [Bradyrhizobium guangdongense]|nr:hypothetical protein C2U70_23895 [Bradyrhizobium guangdongense]